jgi:two-component sensor histidine kinase/type II secretory pathway pseudopilin PulG
MGNRASWTRPVEGGKHDHGTGHGVDQFTVRGTLALLVAFFIAAVAASCALLSWADYRETLNRARQQTANVAALLSEQIGSTFGERDLILRQIKQLLENDGFDALNTKDYGRLIIELATSPEGLGPTNIMDANGRLILNTGRLAPGTDLSDRPYFRAHKDSIRNDLVVSDPVKGPLTGRDTFALSRRIDNPDGSLAGVVATVLYPEFFTDMFRSIALGPHSAAALIRDDGTMLARYPAAELVRAAGGTRPFAHDIPHDDAGSFNDVSPADSVPRIVSYHRIDDVPASVAIGVARVDALREWRSRLYRNIGLGAGMLAALMALSFLTLRAIRREEVVRGALHVANEGLDRRVRERTRELEAALDDRQHAVEDKDVLLREVHHRVKNNLQMLQSLVRMTMRRLPEPTRPALNDMVRRIWAVGQVYNLLYASSEVATIDLAAYLDRLCGHLGNSLDDGSHRIVLTTDLAHVVADLDTAVPLGLIVVEIITNAFKHAFPGDRGGRIEVILRQADRARLTIRDNGVGMPSERPDTSTGLQLVTILAGQIDATFDLQRRKDGLTCTLDFVSVRDIRRRMASAAP